MYKISVPIQNRSVTPETREDYLRLLREAGAARVFLVFNDERDLLTLGDNIAFFKSAGISACVWVGETLGHGGVLLNGMTDAEEEHFQPLVNVRGEEREGTRCPLDPDFSAKTAGWVAGIAEAHPDVILLDDDLRLSQHGPAFCCACPRHLALMSEHIGEEVTLDALREHAFSGKPNKYRDAWLYAQGESFRRFCETLRTAVDAVDPSVVLSFCAAHAIWSVDGVDVLGVTRLLAGKNQPLLRLHGAPYWTPFAGGKLPFGFVVSIARMFASFCADSGIETMAEGDVYPRPRFNTPAAYLELFDSIMRADGSHDGILKYMADYTAGPLFETGYFARHKKNQPFYAEVMKNFPDGANLGVRIHVRPHTFPTADFSLTEPRANTPLPIAGAILGCAGFPTVYYGEGITAAAFGEDVRALPAEAFENGMILDALSAIILTEKGVDVGLASYRGFENKTYTYLSTGRAGEIAPVRFADSRTLVATLKAGATTVMTAYIGTKEEPFAYTYENAEGQRFLVYLTDYGTWTEGTGLFDSCIHHPVLTKVIPWLSRRPLPIVGEAHPGLTLLAAKDAAGTSLLFANCFADEIMTPTFTLDEKYTDVRVMGASAHVEENRLVFDTDIPPFSAVTVRLTK